MPLLNFIPSPTWRDLVDILFLTLVAYQLYQWFRETRALRVLIGLVVLGGIYSVAKTWGLFLTTWVFQILWQVLLILLLILFQSEIRQVLEKVSPLRYLRSRRRAYGGTFAANLARVVFELAAEKTGALVVLTRDDNPSQLIHAGQKVMAIPDPMLIKSIFNHHSPAHDGAVIITQDRLTHMGCVLPLSESQELPEQYGTRHRAALGLSELTDAVCLVVSEERSEVTSIVGGKIVHWSQPEALQAQLKEWLGGPEIHVPTIQHFLEDFFIKNWKRKMAAFALVATCWLVLASHQDEDRGQRTEDRGQRTEDRGQRTEDRGQRTEDRGQRTEGSVQRTEDRGQGTEDRGQGTEDRGQRTEDRGQGIEDRGQKTEDGGS